MVRPQTGRSRAPASRGARLQHCIERLEDRRLLSAAIAPVSLSAALATPARQIERLDRGVVAINKGSGNIYISWRLFGTDPSGIAFNIYRSINGGTPVKRNASPITQTTDFSDTGASTTQSNAYFVRPVIGGVEQASSETFTLPAAAPANPYLRVPLQVPPGGVTLTGEAYTYSANDTSVGDVDGDGQYELIVKWDPSNAKDNSQGGYTGNVYLDAYKMNGTRLWRIDLGINIRAGAHYTQFMVYDLDGDGKAEVACKTAPGTVDGAGNNVILGSDNPAADYRNSSGYILSGPEYLTVFNGLTGAAMATVNYVPARGTVSSWGDSYGNRVDRFLATIAYLDGQRPSLVMCRGYYTRAVLAAWDWRGGKLTQRWVFDSDDGTPGNTAYRGQGAHGISVGDVDGDGKDEIIYGAAAIDDNGKGLYSTGLGHGDALHLSDMDPSRPGQEVFMIHESAGPAGAEFRDARTGALIYGVPNTGDTGRGVAFDVDPRYLGYESWSTLSGVMNTQGEVIAPNHPSYNFGIWWDADPLRELLDGTAIDKWNWTSNTTSRLVTGYKFESASGNNGTKNTPAVSGDILGDWREEMVLRNGDSSALLIFTTTTPATNRIYTLMHDVQYREAIAWQNVAYNQPPHPSFFLGAIDANNTFSTPPTPNVFYAGIATTTANLVYQAENASFGGGSTADSNNAGFNGTAFINFPTNGGYLQFDKIDGGDGGLTSISFRYALGITTSRTGRLLINGIPQDITFTPSGSWTTWSLQTLTVPLTAGATNTIRLESTGQDLANIDELQVFVAPAISASHFVFETSPNKLTFTFNEDVSSSLSPGDLIVTRLSGGTVVPSAYSYVDNVATFTLPVSLADGNYRATFVSGGVSDLAGAALSSSFSYDFFVLAGDANRDRTVNQIDLGAVSLNWNKQSGAAFAQGDFNYDGRVDVGDLLILANNWQVKLDPPLAPAAPVSAPVPPVSAAAPLLPPPARRSAMASPVLSPPTIVRVAPPTRSAGNVSAVLVKPLVPAL